MLYGGVSLGGAAWFRLSRSQRRAALRNYAAALGLDPEHKEVRSVSSRAFANYGRMLADFLLLGSARSEEVAARVALQGLEVVDEALSAGRGLLVCLPHMASWDMAGSAAAIHGYRVSAVAETFPGSLDSAVVDARQGFGLRVIHLGRSAVGTIGEELRKNGIVALVCDLPQPPGVEVEFLGQKAMVPSGPGSLAIHHRVPVITARVRMAGRGRYTVQVDPPLDLAGLDRQGIMQQVTRRFEAYIRDCPEQWFAFKPIFQGG